MSIADLPVMLEDELPHGSFALHVNELTRDYDNKPTLYVVCSCGRGYAFGQRAGSDELFAWLADHDWDRPGQEARADG